MRRRGTQPRASRRREPSWVRRLALAHRDGRSLWSVRRRRTYDRFGDEAVAGAERPATARRLRVRPWASAAWSSRACSLQTTCRSRPRWP